MNQLSEDAKIFLNFWVSASLHLLNFKALLHPELRPCYCFKHYPYVPKLFEYIFHFVFEPSNYNFKCQLILIAPTSKIKLEDLDHYEKALKSLWEGIEVIIKRGWSIY